jgi:aminocarboxymuconate-semialdehyde decarboxylase
LAIATSDAGRPLDTTVSLARRLCGGVLQQFPRLKLLYLDTLTYGLPPLQLALDTVGADHVCFGSDSPPVPFPLAQARSLGLVEALPVSDQDRAEVRGGTAARLFRLGHDRPGVGSGSAPGRCAAT